MRIGSTAAVAVAALSLSAVSANAGVLVSSAPSCDDQPLATPFAPWLDLAQYTPLAGGNFESSSTGWTLSGGAAVAAGNEPFQVRGAADAASLALPSGAMATSPPICVGVEHPTIRFFAKRTNGGLLGLAIMRVDVLFENQLGLVTSLPIGIVSGSASWQPTLPMPILANLLPLLPSQHTAVAFSFTPLLGGTWSIDDVEVDPYNS